MIININELAKDARPINDNDWGSERQIRAENEFFAEVENRVTRAQFAKLDAYCLKATTEERIDAALVLIAANEAV